MSGNTQDLTPNPDNDALPPALPIGSRHKLSGIANEHSHTLAVPTTVVGGVHGTEQHSFPDSIEDSFPAVAGYQIAGFVGRGGMGIVYRATDEKLRRQVALKILPTLRNTETARSRFESEARLLAQVDHPGVARVFEVGSSGGISYIAMEFVEGLSLDRLAAGKPIDPVRAAEFVRQLAEALSACHAIGIIHRDVKPGNAIVTAEDKLKLTDFGLAKLMGDESQNLTRTGEVVGTPGYMAPEQASGLVREFGPETDVYGAGAVLYELLTGRPPFAAPDPVQTLLLALTAVPAAPRSILPQIPADLETITLKCLEKNKSYRYRSTKELADDLHRYLCQEPIRAKPASPLRKGWSWIRRHPASSSVAGIVILGAIAGFVGISIHNAQLQAELDRTQRLVVEGRTLSDWLLNDFTRVLESDEGLTFVRSNLADRIQNYLDSLQREVVDDDVKLSLAESLIRLAVLQGSPSSGSLGMPDQCRRYLVSAQSVLSSLRNPDSTRARILAVVIPTELADLQLSLGESDGRKLLAEARANLSKLPSEKDTRVEQSLHLQLLCLELFQATRDADFATASHTAEELAKIAPHMLQSETQPDRYAQTLNQIARAQFHWLESQGRTSDIIPDLQAGLDRLRTMAAGKQSNLTMRLNRTSLCNLLGQAYYREQKTTEAETLFLEVKDSWQVLLERDAKNLGARFNLGHAWQSLGDVSLLAGDLTAAGERLQIAARLYSEYAEMSGSDLASHPDTLDVFMALAHWHMQQGQLESARHEIERAIAGFAACSDRDWKHRVQHADALLLRAGIDSMAFNVESDFEGPEVPPDLRTAYERAMQSLQTAIDAFAALQSSGQMTEHIAAKRNRAQEMREHLQNNFRQLESQR